MDNEELLSVRVRLQDARAFMADAAKTAASVAGIGVATEEASAKAKLSRIETFAWRQSLYTLRRELFYGTAAAGAFALETLHLGLAFDEAKAQGTGAFTAILGSATLATQEMSTLVDLTHQTGVGLGLLTGQAEQMQGFGFTIKEINTDLQALANYAERTGRGSAGLQSLVQIFDRIRQSGRLTSLDLRALNSEGISGLQILTQRLHLSASQAAALRAGKLIVPAQYALPALSAGIGARADQLGTDLGQQVGITHSYLSSLFGGGEQGLFSFATRGLEAVNRALKVASDGGGLHGFLLSLDPSGGLVIAWNLLAAAVKGAIAPFVLTYRIVSQLQQTFPFLTTILRLFARQTWLVEGALFALSSYLVITRGAMLGLLIATRIQAVAMWYGWAAMRAFYVAEALATGGMWLLNVAMDANPVGLLIIGIAGLAAGLVILTRHFQWARDASAWLRKPIFHWSDLNPWKGGFGLHVPGLAGGGTATAGGWSMVGERGPELRYLPKGASVVPLKAAGATLAGGLDVDRLAAAIAVALTSVRIESSVVNLDGRAIADNTFWWKQKAEASM